MSETTPAIKEPDNVKTRSKSRNREAASGDVFPTDHELLSANYRRQRSCDLIAAQKGSDEDLRRRSTSMVEAKEQTYQKLRDELLKAQEELQLKDEECGKLERVRDQMEQELEELTASLFEEANKMVQDANVKRMHTEKLYTEATNNIEVLQAEVEALKALVLTSTPSAPNRHLHPQIDQVSKEAPAGSSLTKKLSFKKTHKRSTSHHITKVEQHADFVFDASKPAPGPPPIQLEDPECFELFCQWKENPTLSKDSAFLARLLEDDVRPCLRFSNTKLSEKVVDLVQTNAICIEPIPGTKRSMKKCPIMGRNSMCSYRLKLGEEEPWLEICEIVRNRITTACELFNYLRYVMNGLIKNGSNTDMYWHIIRLRKEITLARLGLS